MADGYMITSEDEDGMQWDDPVVYDTEAEARAHVEKAKKPPEQYAWALYRLEYMGDPTEA